MAVFLAAATVINRNSCKSAEEALWVPLLFELASSPGSITVNVSKQALVTSHQGSNFISPLRVRPQIQAGHCIKQAVKVWSQRGVYFCRRRAVPCKFSRRVWVNPAQLSDNPAQLSVLTPVAYTSVPHRCASLF